MGNKKRFPRTKEALAERLEAKRHHYEAGVVGNFWEHLKKRMVPLRFMGATKTDGLETRFFFCYVYIYTCDMLPVLFFCGDCKTQKKTYMEFWMFFFGTIRTGFVVG